jgi:mevalonate kinase
VPEFCGKLTLCGEHFVLFGAPAVALPWSGGTLRLRAHREQQECIDQKIDPRLLEAWNVALGLAGLPAAATFPFVIDSTIPVGAGFGSSAALSVALVAASTQQAGKAVSDVENIAASTQVEAVFHGRSSGLDPAAVLLRRPVLREAGGSLKPLSWRLSCPDIVLAMAAGERQTAEAVERSRSFASTRSGRFHELMDEAGALVLEAASLMECAEVPGTEERLGVLLTRNHAMLWELGVSSDALDRLVDAALSGGAMGAKLCGAGLGGAVLALPRPGESGKVEEAMKRAGAKRVMTWHVSDTWGIRE